MVYSITQNVYYKPGTGVNDHYSMQNYYAQTNIYYEYRPNESKIYITSINVKLTDRNHQDITEDLFKLIAGIPNNGTWPYWRTGDPLQMGVIKFFVNGTPVLSFNASQYAFQSESHSKKILMQDFITYQGSFSISSPSDIVTFQFSDFGTFGGIYDTRYKDYTYRYLQFCTMNSAEVLPITETYEVKSSGLVGNSGNANDSTGNIRLKYEIRHYNTNEDIVYDNTLFSVSSGGDYLFYKLEVGRENCANITHAKIGIGVNDSTQQYFTSNYTTYPSGNTYLKILVNNIDIIQYLRESIYNATSQSFQNKTAAGTGNFPMYTGETGSGNYNKGLTYSGSWYQVFDSLTINDTKIIPQGLYPLTPGTTIDITLSCSNLYQHYGYTGGTQNGYYWFSNGGNTCNQFHVPLNPGSNNTVTGIFVPTDGYVYIHNGTNFEAYIPYIYNETTSTWEQYLPYIYNGTDWELQG